MTRSKGLILLLVVIITVHGLPKRPSYYALKNKPPSSSTLKNLFLISSHYDNLHSFKRSWKPIKSPDATRTEAVQDAVRTSNYAVNHLPSYNNPENTFDPTYPNIINEGVVAPKYRPNYSYIRSQENVYPGSTKPHYHRIRNQQHPKVNLAVPFNSHKDERHNLYEKKYIPAIANQKGPQYTQDNQRHSFNHHGAIKPHHHRRRPLSAVEQHSPQAFSVGSQKTYIPASINPNPRNLNDQMQIVRSKFPDTESQLESRRIPYLYSLVNSPQELRSSNLLGSLLFNPNFASKPLFDFRGQNQDITKQYQQLKFGGNQQIGLYQNTLKNLSSVTGMHPNLRYQPKRSNPMAPETHVSEIGIPISFYKNQDSNYISAIPHKYLRSAFYPSQQTSLQSFSPAGIQSTPSNLY